MGIEELLPGLLKATEQRFGKRVGGAIATAFLVVLLLGAGAFFLNLFVDNAIRPIAGFANLDIANLNTADVLATFLVFLPGAAIYVAIVIAVNWGMRAWSWRKLREERLHNIRMARAYRSALNRVAADLRAQGIILVEQEINEELRRLGYVISEDAKHE